MDVLRSAHVTTARVGSDNATEASLKWYRCAEGAKAFPHFHAFGNPVWEPHKDDWIRGPGVEYPPEKWVSSIIDAPPGQEFHGKKEWYEKGLPQAILDNPEPHATPPCIVEPTVLTVTARAGLYPADLRRCRALVLAGGIFESFD